MTTALNTVDLGRRYRSKWALRDCSLTVPVGSITGLVGPNGAGKSTLLRLAAGLSRPTTGSIHVFGQPVAPNSTGHLNRIGYFDQLRPLYNGFHVSEMLTLGRRLNSVWDLNAAQQWLTDLGIPLDQQVGNLSLGQQAEVAIALCIGKRPDLLLLDEPVASLDPLARSQLLQHLMGRVAEHGTTVLLSSHIVSELEPVCDNLIILSSSTVQLADSIDSILSGHRLLVGTREQVLPDDLDVVSRQEAGRQVTLLVRGDPSTSDHAWKVLQPGLDEIVLAYLANPRKHTSYGSHEESPQEGGPS